MSPSKTDEGAPLPNNAVDNPILNSPLAEPRFHWDFSGPSARRLEGRRPAGYVGLARTERTGDMAQAAHQLIALPLVNEIHHRVSEWRNAGYPNVTRTTRDLLDHWNREGRRPLFYCQREAVETIIWLTESSPADRQGIDIPFDEPTDLVSRSNSYHALVRYCAKMATGTGKTTVMAMIVTWQVLNRSTNKVDARFTDAILAVAPNLTVRDRLEVLKPTVPSNYYQKFDLVPPGYVDLLHRARVHVTNWHVLAVKDDSGRRGVVQRGAESDRAFVKRVLGDLANAHQILVLNDEAHHAWRLFAPIESPEVQRELTGLSREEKTEANEDAKEATVWVSGLDRINKVLGKSNQRGIKFVVDLSATPFSLKGSGRPEGEPLPWIVSDFSLVDAIESGITKVPRIPVKDDSGKPDPRYFHLWHNIVTNLAPSERGNGKAPKPEAILREAQPALATLASKWRTTHALFKESNFQVPPAIIVVAANTDVAQVFAETIIRGDIIDDLKGDDYTFQIDTKVLKEAEVESGGPTKKVQAQLLRLKTATVGKAEWDGGSPPPSVQSLDEEQRRALDQPPGKNVRCVVSVGMLTEGWDAPNVTQILGLRAFSSQLLCEQVVGRALRRMSHDFDENGMLHPEYADIFGVPFEVIPVQGTGGKPQPPQPPSTLVQADPARSVLAIEFPRVEGYYTEVAAHVICDVDSIPTVAIHPSFETTQTTVAPQLPVTGSSKLVGATHGVETLTRQEFYAQHRVQRTAFEITRTIVDLLVSNASTARSAEANRDPGLSSALFPQVLAIVERVLDRRVVPVDGATIEEVALAKYRGVVIQRILNALDSTSGEPLLKPRIERYRPVGSTRDVLFRTTKPCKPTSRSHISHVTYDSTFEGQAAFYFESENLETIVISYAKNDRLDFTIPYEVAGVAKNYIPDFLVRLRLDDGGELTLILETKGWNNEDAKTKASAAARWVRAVNHHGSFGRWRYELVEDPARIPDLLRSIAQPQIFAKTSPPPASVLEPDNEATVVIEPVQAPPVASDKRQAWNDWVSASRTRNFMLRDPLLDWLGLHGEANGFLRDDKQESYRASTDFTRFIFERGHAFEVGVLGHLRAKAEVVQIADSAADTREASKAKATCDAMRAGVEIIYQGVLHDEATRTYGSPDLLVRSDVLERLFDDPYRVDREWFEAAFGEQPEQPISSIGAAGAGESHHYRVVDVKFSTLHLLKSGELSNEGSARAYKAQVFLYNRALGRAQGYQPVSSFILGRGWEQGSSRGGSCFERLGVVLQDSMLAKDERLSEVVDNAVKWVRQVRENGAKWQVLPVPSEAGLRPNMKNMLDSPWHTAKKHIAEELKDLTMLWQVGVDRRDAACAMHQIDRWDDERLTPEIVGVRGSKQQPILERLLAINRRGDGPVVLPSKVSTAESDWRSPSAVEFFVDFETVSDLDDDFATLPQRGGNPMIFMVGCGHVERDEWVFRTFTVAGLNQNEEARTLDAWFEHMDAVARRLSPDSPPRVFHWSPAEVSSMETAYNSAQRRHPGRSWPIPNWFDFLNRVVKTEPVVVRGALGFGLKAIGKALHKLSLIETNWSDGPTDGLGAMVAAWSAAREATSSGRQFHEMELVREVERYNGVDCRVMYEVINYLRKHH